MVIVNLLKNQARVEIIRSQVGDLKSARKRPRRLRFLHLENVEAETVNGDGSNEGDDHPWHKVRRRSLPLKEGIRVRIHARDSLREEDSEV